MTSVYHRAYCASRCRVSLLVAAHIQGYSFGWYAVHETNTGHVIYRDTGQAIFWFQRCGSGCHKTFLPERTEVLFTVKVRTDAFQGVNQPSFVQRAGKIGCVFILNTVKV